MLLVFVFKVIVVQKSKLRILVKTGKRVWKKKTKNMGYAENCVHPFTTLTNESAQVMFLKSKLGYLYYNPRIVCFELQ